MSPFILVTFFVSIAILYLFVRGLAQRPSTTVKTAYLVFIGVMFPTVLVDFLMRLPFDPAIRLPVIRASFATFLWAGFLYLRFTYAVIARRADVLLWISVALAAASSLASFAYPPPTLTFDPHLQFDVMSLAPELGLLVLVGCLAPGVCAIFLCARHYLRPHDARERNVMAHMLVGSGITLGVWGVLLVIVPAFFPDSTMPLQLLPVSLLSHVCFMDRAVTRHYYAVVDYEQIEEVARSLFENVSEAAVVFGASGEVVQLNAPARTLLGSAVSAEDLPRLIAGYDRAAAYRDETKTVQTPAGARTVLISQTPVAKDDLRLGTLLLMRDATGRVELERERTHMEERVRHVEKMEAVGQLAGGIAHDFNNQLMGISGYADLLREDVAGTAPLERLADGILRATRRSADLTAQLLAFARKGARMTVPVDLDRAVTDVVSLLEHSIDKRVAIRQTRRAPECWTLGDASQLQNAILNLAINARDAMPDGGTLTFVTDVVELDAAYCARTTLGIAPGQYAMVKVVDTGAGMDADALRHLFEPFFTTKGMGKGTGLGLAAVHGTVSSHGGSIDVETAVGAGSTFTVYLPVHDGPRPAPREVVAAHPPAMQRHGARILLVDDEEVVRDTASAMLARKGYVVSTCSDGQEAVERYARDWRAVDLVVLDIAMPRMNGVEVFAAMRRANPDVRVLVASGYSIGGEVQQLLDAGARGFIQKPFRSAELAERVAEVLGGARHGSDRGAP